MKRKNICWLFILLAICHEICGSVAESIATLTTKERAYLKQFYRYKFYKNEDYFDLLDDLEINYLFDIVSIHIKILEDKILQNKSGLKSHGMFKGLGWVVGSLLFGWVAHTSYQSLIMGSFGEVEIPDHKLNNISSIKFSRSEKKALDLLDDRIKANGNQITPLLSPYWYYRIYDLSKDDCQKYRYLVLQLAVKKSKQGILVGSIAGLVCLSAAIYQFYKVSRYAERLVERLKRDERILGLLQDQKDKRYRFINMQNK